MVYFVTINSSCTPYQTNLLRTCIRPTYSVCFWRDSPPVDQGLLIHGVSRSQTTTHHSRYDSFGRVISSSQRPLLDNIQHSQQTNIHASSVGFESTISAGERSQTHALNSAANRTGNLFCTLKSFVYQQMHFIYISVTKH